MLKKMMVALLSLLAASVFAAVDVNKATQAELESIKGIGPSISAKMLEERKKAPFKDWNDLVVRVKGVGEGNAAKFSADGLTVNGGAFAGAPSAQGKEGKSTTKTDSKPSASEAGAGKTTKSAAVRAPDAAPPTTSMDKKGSTGAAAATDEARRKRAEEPAAKDAARAEKKAARKAAAAASAPASAAAAAKKK